MTLIHKFNGTVKNWKSDTTVGTTDSDSDTGVGGSITYPDGIVTRMTSIGVNGRCRKGIVFRVPCGAYAELSIQARRVSGANARVFSESFRIYPNTSPSEINSVDVASTDWKEYRAAVIAPQFTQNYAEIAFFVGYNKADGVGVAEFKLPTLRVFGADGSVSVVEGEMYGSDLAYGELRLESGSVIIDDDYGRFFSRGIESVSVETDGTDEYISVKLNGIESVRRPVAISSANAYQAGLTHTVKTAVFAGNVVRIYVFNSSGSIVSDLSTISGRLDVTLIVAGSMAVF